MKIVNFKDIEKNWTSEIPNFSFLPPDYKKVKRYNQETYCDKICAFDIETTTLRDIKQSFMYVWQFAIEDELVIIGRTWEEFKKLVSILNTLAKYNKIVVFVHNLSYEFVYLSGIFPIDNEDVFIMDSRKILKCNIGQLEFRCSYLLSNLSLKAFTDRYNVKHKKIDGDDFNYNIIRYPWTELTELEKHYIINDVVGLIEAVHELMKLHGDNIYTLPLTSTGLVRRVCRDKINEKIPVFDKYGKPVINKRGEELKVAVYKKEINKCFPSYDVFKMLRQEFRGGNTHANRYFSTEIIKNVTSFDISSSYPSAQCNRNYPVEPFEPIKNISPRKIDKLLNLEKPLLFEVILKNVDLKYKYFPIPYIPTAKCRNLKGIRTDNGRILHADELTITVNDIDWKIITTEYKFDNPIITSGFSSKYGKLPKPIIDCNIEFYKQKTELKGVEGQELYYSKNKELLNSIYIWNDSTKPGKT